MNSYEGFATFTQREQISVSFLKKEGDVFCEVIISQQQKDPNHPEPREEYRWYEMVERKASYKKEPFVYLDNVIVKIISYKYDKDKNTYVVLVETKMSAREIECIRFYRQEDISQKRACKEI